jgi:flagellar biosynthesis protein FlhF
MKIKTFVADSIPEAFRAIKAELGSEAVILGTKYVRTGWSWRHPIGRQQVQVVAAVDRTAPAGSPSVAIESRASAAGERDAAGQPAGFVTFRSWLEASLERGEAGPHTQGSGESARAVSFEQRQAQERYRVSGDASQSESPSRQAGPSPASDRELGEVDRLTVRLSQELVTRGCDLWTAARLADEALARAAALGLPTEVRARQALRGVVMDQVRVSGPLFAGQKRLKAIAVIGPTGVGKTSAVCKLAAYYRLKEGRSVAVAKVEREPAGEADPLRIFADSIGLTVETVSGRRELADVVSTNLGAELLLIDQPGHSLLDWEAMDWLRGLFSGDLPIEVHLALPANTNLQDFLDVTNRYTGLPIHRLLFTKLDETTRFGRLFEILCRSRLPVSYLTAGQRLSDDLDIARAERLADLFCRGPSDFGECERRGRSSFDGEASTCESRMPQSDSEPGAPQMEAYSSEGGRRWTRR